MSLAPSSTSIDHRLEEYLQWLTIEKGRSRSTIESYRRDVSSFITWWSPHVEPTQLTTRDLEAYVNSLRESYAPASVARSVAALRGFLSFLLDEGWIPEDPGDRIGSTRLGRSLPKPLSEEEMLRLLNAVPRESPLDLRDAALLEFLYGTGARASEVVGLDMGDLDFDEELIRVTGKGSKQRLVPMGTVLKAQLVHYLSSAQRQLVLNARPIAVFVNARGTRLSRQGIDLVVKRHALRVGIARERVSAHVFRHSCATHMLAHGADVRVVQELLGHASISTTQIYTAVSLTTLHEQYDLAHPRAHD